MSHRNEARQKNTGFHNATLCPALLLREILLLSLSNLDFVYVDIFFLHCHAGTAGFAEIKDHHIVAII